VIFKNTFHLYAEQFPEFIWRNILLPLSSYFFLVTLCFIFIWKFIFRLLISIYKPQLECANYYEYVLVERREVTISIGPLHDLKPSQFHSKCMNISFPELGWSHGCIAGCSHICLLSWLCLSLLLARKRTLRRGKNNRNSKTPIAV
jgi:hypothetical protein